MSSTDNNFELLSSGEKWQGLRYEFPSFEAAVKHDCQAAGIFFRAFTNPPVAGIHGVREGPPDEPALQIAAPGTSAAVKAQISLGNTQSLQLFETRKTKFLADMTVLSRILDVRCGKAFLDGFRVQFNSPLEIFDAMREQRGFTEHAPIDDAVKESILDHIKSSDKYAFDFSGNESFATHATKICGIAKLIGITWATNPTSLTSLILKSVKPKLKTGTDGMKETVWNRLNHAYDYAYNSQHLRNQDLVDSLIKTDELQ